MLHASVTFWPRKIGSLLVIPHAGVGSSRNFNHKQAICNFTTKIYGLERFSHVEERLNILGLETLNWHRVILDLIFYVINICKILSRLIKVILCRHLQLDVTEWNCIRNSAKSMRDINSSLIMLLIYGILYLQQSSLALVWLFLNEIQWSWHSAAFYRAMLCIRGTSHGPVSVRPSVRHKLEFY